MNKLLEHQLRSHNYKVTPPRVELFALLQNGPATPKELADTLSPRVDRASTYRTIALFEQLGVIHHLVLGGKRVIELTDTFSRHHHHLSCTRCGTIEAIDDPALETSLHAMIDSHGFSAQAHTIEVSGTCASCTGATR